MLAIFEEGSQQTVQREEAGAEEHDDQAGEKKGERGRLGECGGIAPKSSGRLQICCEIGDDHAEGERDGDQARAQPQDQKHAPHALESRHTVGIEGGEWNLKVLKKSNNMLDVLPLSHSGL